MREIHGVGYIHKQKKFKKNFKKVKWMVIKLRAALMKPIRELLLTVILNPGPDGPSGRSSTVRIGACNRYIRRKENLIVISRNRLKASCTL